MRVLRLLAAASLIPLATGILVVTYGDATLIHLPGKAVIQGQIREWTIPFVHTAASCGQPLAGNPSFGTFLPDTLLLPLLPAQVVFGLRFALALLLAYLGARRWARAEGVSREAAEMAAFGFVLSGVFLSTWRFYNSGLALACAAWVQAALSKLVLRAAAGDTRALRRAAAEMGLWSGLCVLAGEPVIVILSMVLVAGRTLHELASPRARGAPRARRRVLLSLAAATLVAGSIAAPQVAATVQILPDSGRQQRPFNFFLATASSTPLDRVVEQVVPFPRGRPDLRGPGGFEGRAPYLWTLHLGLPILGLLLLFGRPLIRAERLYWAIGVVGVILACGRHLPGAKSLFFPGFKVWHFLSLWGRIRMPVKWWYLVLLALVPLVALSAERWSKGHRASSGRIALAIAAIGLSIWVLATNPPKTPLAGAGPWASIAVLAALVLVTARGFPRAPSLLAGSTCVVLILCNLPLLLALVDRPHEPPAAAVPDGRLYLGKTHIEPHMWGGARASQAKTTRAFFRQVRSELWPLASAVDGVGYAFDEDPEGAYAEVDQALGRTLIGLPWSARVAELRLAGVRSVVTTAELSPPYRPARPLNARGLWLYELDGASPTVRFASRITYRNRLRKIVEYHLLPDFDPSTDVVLIGDQPERSAERMVARQPPIHPEVLREAPDHIAVKVKSSVSGILIWSRTHLSAWRATIDGRQTATVLADGHLVGVPVPAGEHRVEVYWPRLPVVSGALLAVLALAFVAYLQRR